VRKRRKLTNKKPRIIRQLSKNTPIKEKAAVMRVAERRIYQIQKDNTGRQAESLN
jgi:hypothetical protein